MPADLPACSPSIDHVGIAVPDLDEAIAFYRDTFGIVSVHEETNEEQGVREAMLRRRRRHRRRDPAAGPAERELDDREVPRPQRPRAAAGGLHGSTTSRRSAATLRERGPAAALRRARGAAPPDSRVNFIHPKDAGGVLVELVEPAAALSTSDVAHGTVSATVPAGNIVRHRADP